MSDTTRPRANRGRPDLTRSGRKLIAGLAALFLAGGLCATASASEIGILRIKNDSNATWDFIVVDPYFGCMDFPLPKNAEGVRTTVTVAPNTTKDVDFAKDGRCEGEQGVFQVQPMRGGKPHGNQQAFWTDSDANLEQIWNDQTPTGYPSVLSRSGSDPASGRKVFEWNVTLPGYEVGTPRGKWILGCAGGQGCTKTLSSSVENGQSAESTQSREMMQAFSVTVSGGFEFAGASGGTEFTASSETTTGESETLARSNTIGTVDECETPTDMNEFQVYALWQWAVEAYVGPDLVVTKTCQVTCTQTGAPPTFLPGSPESINACMIAKTDETQKAAIAQATAEEAAQTLAAARDKVAREAARTRQASCVTFYTGRDGSGTPLEICGEDFAWKDYINLGSSGAGIHSHHGDVQSFRCAPGVGYVQFMNGNATPMPRHNESCKAGAIVNPNIWVKNNATGVGLYAKPQKCCGE